MSLARRITVVFLVLALVPLAGLGVTVAVLGGRYFAQEARGDLVIQNELKLAELRRWIDSNRRQVEAMAQRPLVREYVDVLGRGAGDPGYPGAREALHRDHLVPLAGSVGGFESLSLLHPVSGQILVSSDSAQDGKFRESSAFFRAGRARSFVGAVEYSVAEDSLVMHVATPILDPEGETLGVLAGHLDWGEVTRLLRSGEDHTESRETYLVDDNHFLVSESRFLPAGPFRPTVRTQGVDACLTGADGTELYLDYRGVPVVGAYHWLETWSLCLVTEEDQGEAFALLRGMRLSMLWAALVAAVIAVAAALRFTRGLTSPLRRLGEAAENVGAGDLSHRTRLTGRDELALLGQAFDAMAENLETTTASRDDLEREVRERERVTAQLARAELRFRTLFQNAPDGVLLIDPQTAKPLEFNDTACGQLGYSREEFGEVAIGEYELPEAPEMTRARMEEIQTTGAADFETRHRRKDGAERQVRVSVRTLEEAGRTLLHCIYRDVTDLRRAEQALLVEQERFRIFVEGTSELVTQVGGSGAFSYVNPSAATLLGVDAEQCVGMSAFDFVHPEDRDATQQAFAGWLDAHLETASFQNRQVNRADGSVRHLLWSVTIRYGQDGSFAGVDSIGRDITERVHAEQAVAQKAEELARSNAELEQFAYVASHDLQEPLRMVSSYVQLLQRRYAGQLDQDADEFIAFAVDGAVRMKSLINDLLAFSRIGTRCREPEPVPLEQPLADALLNLAVSLEESGGRVTHEPLPTVDGDPSQLTQLLQNLVGNAVKFRGEAPPEVHLSAERRGDAWVISVADNGIGIDPAHAERVFGVFQRLHGRDEYPGTGIGLALCKKIVERHGGQLWVDSRPGEGAAFRFTLPVDGMEEHHGTA